MQVSALEKEVSQLIISELRLEEIKAEDVDPQAPLFGEGEGMGLDSIDALELALAISRDYGCQLRADDEEYSQIFASVRNLSQYIEAHGTQ